jgi:hypothetical protein
VFQVPILTLKYGIPTLKNIRKMRGERTDLFFEQIFNNEYGVPGFYKCKIKNGKWWKKHIPVFSLVFHPV